MVETSQHPLNAEDFIQKSDASLKAKSNDLSPGGKKSKRNQKSKTQHHLKDKQEIIEEIQAPEVVVTHQDALLVQKVVDQPILIERVEQKDTTVIHKPVIHEVHEQKTIEVHEKPLTRIFKEAPVIEKYEEAPVELRLHNELSLEEKEQITGKVVEVNEKKGETVASIQAKEQVKEVIYKPSVEIHERNLITEIHQRPVIKVYEQPITKTIIEKPVIKKFVYENSAQEVIESQHPETFIDYSASQHHKRGFHVSQQTLRDEQPLSKPVIQQQQIPQQQLPQQHAGSFASSSSSSLTMQQSKTKMDKETQFKDTQFKDTQFKKQVKSNESVFQWDQIDWKQVQELNGMFMNWAWKNSFTFAKYGFFWPYYVAKLYLSLWYFMLFTLPWRGGSWMSQRMGFQGRNNGKSDRR